MFTCSVCNIENEFPKVEELEIHIAMDHIKHLPYECDKCTFARFPTEYAVRYHYKQTHHVINRKDVRFVTSADSSQKQQEVKAILNSSIRASTRIQDRARAEKKAVESSPEVIYEDCIAQEIPDKSYKSKDLADVEADIPDNDESEDGSNESVEGIDDEGAEEAQAAPSQPNKVLEQMPCLECGQMTTAQRTSFSYHVNTRHLRRPLFRCTGCNKSWMTIARSDVIKHIKTAHGGDLSLIEDNRDLYNEEIRDTVKAYFPYKVVQPPRANKPKRKSSATTSTAKRAKKTTLTPDSPESDDYED